MLAALCNRCTRTARLETRVSCTAVLPTGRPCGAHRIIEHSPTCLVCGGYAYAPVPPSVGDLPAIYADLVHLVGRVFEVDPSPEHLALTRQVADLHAAFLRTFPKSHPDPWSAA